MIRTVKTRLKQQHENYIRGIKPDKEEEKREALARSYIDLIIGIFDEVFEADQSMPFLEVTFFTEGPNNALYLTCSSIYLEPIRMYHRIDILRDAIKYAEEYDINAQEDGNHLDFWIDLDD